MPTVCCNNISLTSYHGSVVCCGWMMLDSRHSALYPTAQNKWPTARNEEDESSSFFMIDSFPLWITQCMPKSTHYNIPSQSLLCAQRCRGRRKISDLTRVAKYLHFGRCRPSLLTCSNLIGARFIVLKMSVWGNEDGRISDKGPRVLRAENGNTMSGNLRAEFNFMAWYIL